MERTTLRWKLRGIEAELQDHRMKISQLEEERRTTVLELRGLEPQDVRAIAYEDFDALPGKDIAPGRRRTVSPETRAKQSEAMRRRWQQKKSSQLE
jgi:hypothetical protein